MLIYIVWMFKSKIHDGSLKMQGIARSCPEKYHEQHSFHFGPLPCHAGVTK